MSKSITLIAAVALALTVSMPRQGVAAADTPHLFIMAVDYDVVPGQVDNFIAAAKDNATASVKEPGCHELNLTVSQKDPNHVFIFEVYDSAAAFEAHVATEHFKKYKAITKDMIAKREVRPLWSASMNMKGM